MKIHVVFSVFFFNVDLNTSELLICMVLFVDMFGNSFLFVLRNCCIALRSKCETMDDFLDERRWVFGIAVLMECISNFVCICIFSL